MPVAIAQQLKASGIDVITVQDTTKFGEDDPDLLDYASNEGRVLCSLDADFLRLAETGIEHDGIVFVVSKRREIGTIVRALHALYGNQTADSMKNTVVYL